MLTIKLYNESNDSDIELSLFMCILTINSDYLYNWFPK